MQTCVHTLRRGGALAFLMLAVASAAVFASSHMDAPLITLDDPANTTDVYAFVSAGDGKDSTPYLTTALAVYPFEEPGIGPNTFRFDDNVRYEIHVALGDDVAAGRKTISYQFHFETTFQNQNTILQSFLGPIEDVFDDNQNLRQTYDVTMVDHRPSAKQRHTRLGRGMVPPNNQGLLTRFYNQDNDGEMPAKGGVDSEDALDRYTRQAIANLENGHRVFAGQRDDGFYADIQSIFDLDFTFSGPNKPFDSQGGFNVHTIVLQIPLRELGGPAQIVGVYATTSRRQVTVLSQASRETDDSNGEKFVQVGRQGNPLFNEALVAIVDKDLYNRTEPTKDQELFAKYALAPELAAALGLPDELRTDRTDLAAIFIPDLIKVDLSTGPARLAGNPDDPGFNRLGIFGDDTLQSTVQAGFGDGVVPGGWPNGRRFGDDVLDIAIIALASDLRVSPPMINTLGGNIDGVVTNDITFNKVMPYAATPLNGRNHGHHGQTP